MIQWQLWQPIETAPKDGTVILVWSRRLGMLPAFFGRTDEINPPAWHGGHCRVNHIDQPTHWMRLPEPPK
jgi:hypothetical protein